MAYMEFINLSIADFLSMDDSAFVGLPMLQTSQQTTLYSVLATLMAQAWYALSDAAVALQLPPETIVELHQLQPEIDLLSMYYVTGGVMSRQALDLKRFAGLAYTLNSWALSDSGAPNIDTMLTMQGATVPQGWADICAAIGVTIRDVNISG